MQDKAQLFLEETDGTPYLLSIVLPSFVAVLDQDLKVSLEVVGDIQSNSRLRGDILEIYRMRDHLISF